MSNEVSDETPSEQELNIQTSTTSIILIHEKIIWNVNLSQ
jgi:hypothetical protein